MAEQVDRREFMKRAAIATAGAGLGFPALGKAAQAAPSDKVIVGVIGTGRQGRGDLKAFRQQPDVEIAAVCDVYKDNLDQGLKDSGGKAQSYTDFRQVLDRKDIDAVVVGTPDHWHPLVMIEACKAGKDVYVEKPICHTIDEGILMVEAARRYNRVVQVGTQQRSGIHFQKAVKLVQDGFIGKVSFVRTWNYANSYPEGIGNPADCDPPTNLDWNAWLGPAPKVAFNWNRFGPDPNLPPRWSTFRYFWDYAGGFMTDWGVHLIDIVQWAMQVEAPSVIASMGGKYYIKDNAETPDTLQVTYEYRSPDFVCVYENRWDNANSMYGKDYGIEFHGTDGTLFVDRGGFQVFPEQHRVDHSTNRYAPPTMAEVIPPMEMKSANNSHSDHVRNFLDCMKSRQRPISDIEIGHRSTSACLLGNVAFRSKERIQWDVKNQKLLSGGSKAQQLVTRNYRAPWKLAV
ncbi:MAG TPA: Gfo/Idh/MocA family oxidoreductase [Terriglobia bacterium]|nr:Gfo/Idh/MocA family oxidoreductase [Terriglobia bacterium]